jgi:hypothetical protein
MAMSAVNLDPSSMLDVSRQGESVPLTSWWSRDSMTGPVKAPLATASLMALAIPMRAAALAYLPSEACTLNT